MTRLRPEWIRDSDKDINEIDRKIKKMTGKTLTALAFQAAGIDEIPRSKLEKKKVATIRITSGMGVIRGFSEAICDVAKLMGMETFVTDDDDFAGLSEASWGGADVVFAADDDNFVAVNAHGDIINNDIATAKGYTTALSLIAGGLQGKKVTLLGVGKVGKIALDLLKEEGADVFQYDIGPKPFPLSGLVFDATNQGRWLGLKELSEDITMVALGVPLSLEAPAYEAYYDKVLHDPLQTGVAVMIAMALAMGDGSD